MSLNGAGTGEWTAEPSSGSGNAGNSPKPGTDRIAEIRIGAAEQRLNHSSYFKVWGSPAISGS
jgi:hypothetical protein